MLADKHLLWCILLCVSQAAKGLALPTPGSSALQPKDAPLEPRAKGFANGMALRIMPLGASITFGYGSKDKNGYRKALRDKLEENGNKVNMVGTNPSGDMKDNESEGWKSYTVAKVHDKAKEAVPKFKPNVILLNAGTNDCIGNNDVGNAGNRVTDLLNDAFKQSPKATVIVSTLIVNRDDAIQKRIKDFNDQLRTVVNKFKMFGKHIVLVDMQGNDGPKKEDLIDDGTHPNDNGYKKMAKIWFDGIKQADERHFLQEAEKVEGLAPDGA